VATKGGLTRPEGRWVPDGRAKHLVAACEASRVALGVESIDLYQLHAPDPRTPLTTSVRALAALKRDGRIRGVGLSNVSVGQIEEARGIVEIDAVQVEASFLQERWEHGVPVRCVWLKTSLEDAQVNAVARMVSCCGRLLGPEGMRAVSDPALLAPNAQFRYRRDLEPPSLAEGFTRIDEVAFERRRDPSHTARGVLLKYDGVLRIRLSRRERVFRGGF